ncbi:PREDICTED: uncharacterized protein LOC106806127 isoform X2 [Priapulus caudatus]|uniref:Uncharacterized protein LOC106806127 isoform X2 n=1 Tax=Priapulus caudatus TaxID=37621 RepID=A0ABM1DU46_PRICU|nr:PREDICTED: uncharacterized protein LOC106806127 isoform X2 [Priapulus caudatus]
MKMRADAGTENVDVASVQAFLRKGGNDAFAGDKSFQYGRPTANQRIESFWAQLMKSWTRWWRSYFAEMVDQGHLDTGNMLHRWYRHAAGSEGRRFALGAAALSTC